MGPLNMGEAQHPSIRPNGRGGLVRMDGETAVVASKGKDSSCLDAKLEGLEEEWRGSSRHQGSAAIFWAMLPQIDDDNITCTICITIATEKE